MKKLIRSKKGFTLIEIIIVLVIVSLLAVVLYPKLKGREDSAKITSSFIEILRIYEAAKAYTANRGDKNFGSITNISTLTTAGVLDSTQVVSVFGSNYTAAGSGINLTVTVPVQNTNADAQVCSALATKLTNAGYNASCTGTTVSVTFSF